MALCGQTLCIATLFLCCSFATCFSMEHPLLQQHKDRVGKLPGQNFNINFAHYAGYITVNEEAGRTLFYWFIEALEDPQSKPLVLWLNGGPGCSSIAFGQSEEIGPFHIKSDGNLYPNPYSWNGVANILFIETPVGVGFSYSNNESDYLINGDKRTAEDNLVFLLKWFERFPQYKGRDFFISGESYAGHYVPQLSKAIVKYNSDTNETAINLKGFMVGNALTDDFYDQLGMFEFMWSTGLISDKSYKQLKQLCVNESVLHPSDNCAKTLEIANKELGNIDLYSLYTPVCQAKVSQLARRKRGIGRLNAVYDPCTELYAIEYFNKLEVQTSLHVDPDRKPATWQTCNLDIYDSWKDSPRTMRDVYHELIDMGLRIWVFSGNTDVVLPVTCARNSINALGLQIASPWRAWYEDVEVGGWTQEYDGLTLVVVRGAGHEVPLHKPKHALTLIKAFLAGTSMPDLEPVSVMAS